MFLAVDVGMCADVSTYLRASANNLYTLLIGGCRLPILYLATITKNKIRISPTQATGFFFFRNLQVLPPLWKSMGVYQVLLTKT